MAAAKVRSTNHGTGRAGMVSAKTVVLIRLSVSRALESSTAVKVARYPRARRRARKKSCSLEKSGSAKTGGEPDHMSLPRPG
eukprot:4743171-Pleurochrysis_carterae.AAC.1